MTQLTAYDKIQLIHQLTQMNDAVNPANFEPTLPPPTHGPGSRIEQLQLGLESTELIHNNELTSSLSLMKLTRCSPSLKHPNKTLTCKHPNDANDTIDANYLSTRHVCKLRPEQVNDNVVTSQAMTQFRESQSETTSHHKNSTSEIEETQQMQLTQLTD